MDFQLFVLSVSMLANIYIVFSNPGNILHIIHNTINGAFMFSEVKLNGRVKNSLVFHQIYAIIVKFI